MWTVVYNKEKEKGTSWSPGWGKTLPTRITAIKKIIFSMMNVSQSFLQGWLAELFPLQNCLLYAIMRLITEALKIENLDTLDKFIILSKLFQVQVPNLWTTWLCYSCSTALSGRVGLMINHIQQSLAVLRQTVIDREKCSLTSPVLTTGWRNQDD